MTRTNSDDIDTRGPNDASEVKPLVLKTSSKPMALVSLTQLISFTSGTSSGSAKVMSTHCTPTVSRLGEVM